MIAAKTLGEPGKPSDFANDNSITFSEPGSMDKVIAFISEKHLKLDPKPIEEKFKTEVPILQADETVELAFKCGRDMFLLTNKRVIEIDVQGKALTKGRPLVRKRLFFIKFIQCLQSSLAQDGGANHWQHCITDLQEALKTLIKSS